MKDFVDPNLIDIISGQSCTTKDYILSLSSLIRNDSYKMEIYLLTVNRTLLSLVALALADGKLPAFIGPMSIIECHVL